MSDKLIIDISSGTNEEHYCTWYVCPDCDCCSIAIDYSYCPECGKEISWDTSTADRIKKEEVRDPAIDETRRLLIEGELI